MTGGRWIFWIPGRFRLTNEMLSDLRAVGFASGHYGRTSGRYQGRGRLFDAFNHEVRQIRETAALVTKAAAKERRRVPVAIRIAVCGHHKHDPDAWYLLAKAIIDGMVASRFLASDRREVGWVAGRVLQTGREEYEQGHSPSSGAGAIVRVEEQDDGCGHA